MPPVPTEKAWSTASISMNKIYHRKCGFFSTGQFPSIGSLSGQLFGVSWRFDLGGEQKATQIMSAVWNCLEWSRTTIGDQQRCLPRDFTLQIMILKYSGQRESCMSCSIQRHISRGTLIHDIFFLRQPILVRFPASQSYGKVPPLRLVSVIKT